MKNFTLRLADHEMDILEQESLRTERKKTDILREVIRILPNRTSSELATGVPQPLASGKLTRADVARVVYSLWNAGYIFMPDAQSNLTKEAFLNTVIEEMIEFDLEVED